MSENSTEKEQEEQVPRVTWHKVVNIGDWCRLLIYTNCVIIERCDENGEWVNDGETCKASLIGAIGDYP